MAQDARLRHIWSFEWATKGRQPNSVWGRPAVAILDSGMGRRTSNLSLASVSEWA